MSRRADTAIAEVSKMVSGMHPEDRRALCDKLVAVWERKYRDFILTNGSSEYQQPGSEPIVAADFLLTITGIAALARPS